VCGPDADSQSCQLSPFLRLLAPRRELPADFDSHIAARVPRRCREARLRQAQDAHVAMNGSIWGSRSEKPEKHRQKGTSETSEGHLAGVGEPTVDKSDPGWRLWPWESFSSR